MFSIPNYVPFCDVADMCFEAAQALSMDGRRPNIPAFQGWNELGEWPRIRVVRTLAALLEDMFLLQPKQFALISVSGRFVRPSNRILGLQYKSVEISLQSSCEIFDRYASLRFGRYTFLDTSTWCIKRAPFDPADVEVDDDGKVSLDPEDEVVANFLGWSLAVANDDAPKNAEALLEELIAADVMREKSPKVSRRRGRPSPQKDVQLYYFSKYPNGHSLPTTWQDIEDELAAVGITAGRTTIKAAINSAKNEI